MRPVRFRAGHLCVALLLAACHAAAQQDPVAVAPPLSACAGWETRFYNIEATWLGSGTPRGELERAFGLPGRVEKHGACEVLHYAQTGCSSVFTVCSQGRVVSKTLSLGATAVPAMVTGNPEELAGAIESLQRRLREMREEIGRLEQVIQGLAPAPAPAVSQAAAPPAKAAKKAAVRRQCGAQTEKGERCSRSAAEGGDFCWQHRPQRR